MSQSKESLIYDFIVDNNLATEDEISLVTHICGWSIETLNNIIDARSGYHSAKQCVECEPDCYQMSESLMDYYGLLDEEEDEEEDEN